MCKFACAAGVVRDDITVSSDLVLIGDKTFETYRSSCVKLGCADTDLGAESVAETIGETCTAVPESITGRDTIHELLGNRGIRCNDRIRVSGTVLVDMCHRFFEAGYDLNRNLVVQILVMPLLCL